MGSLFTDHGKVVIRTPLYSYHTLFGPNKQTKNLDDAILQLLDDPVFIEGLYWASPQLYQKVLEYNKGNYDTSKEVKLIHTLKKYALRACTRCTPYGIFAGINVADIETKEVDVNEVMKRKVRVDVELLRQIKCKIESEGAIWPNLHYKLNNSLYCVFNQYRFLESFTDGKKYTVQISAIEKTEFLEKIVSIFGSKEISIKDIYALANLSNEAVQTNKLYAYEDINNFVRELVATQFLISELQQGPTIANELERFKNTLSRLADEGIKSVRKYITLFSHIDQALIQFDQLPIGNLPVKEIDQVMLGLKRCGIEQLPEHLFQADLKHTVHGPPFLTKKHIQGIKKAISVLGRLSPPTSPWEAGLTQFKRLFYERYETKEVPLVEVLDPEVGIGFPPTQSIGNIAHQAFIEDVKSPFSDMATFQKGTLKIGKGTAWLQNKIASSDFETLRRGIELKEEDLAHFEEKNDQLANHFTVMGYLLSSGNISLQMVGGAHANPLFGRFAYADGKMAALCKELSQAEKVENKGVIFAEIVFLPQERVGNVARRPVLSDHEIPILSLGGLECNKQILLNDLMVSLQQDEIIIRSRRLNKRVVPRLSNAHNFAISLVPPYQFLAAIQHHGKMSFSINWGALGQHTRFLPRLSYKNIIVHQACWFLFKDDIHAIIRAVDPLHKLKSFLKKWEVPQFICLAEGDNELLIDTRNESYLKVLLKEIKNNQSVKLIEWLHKDINETPFIQQFILPLARKEPVRLKPFKCTPAGFEIQRTFTPGSEWLYFKIYCGAWISDKILLDVVKPSIRSLLTDETIKKAFFIRYVDPHYHLRFRLHLSDKKCIAGAMSYVNDLLRPFCNNDLVWKVQLDTYHREVERYGVQSMSVSEELFFYDSLVYLDCLANENFPDNEQIRFLTALKNLDRWLALYNMSLEEKLNFCMEMSQVFSNEFDKDIRRRLERKYREWRNLIPVFMNSDRYDNEFNERDKNLNEMMLPAENIFHYIHMSMNRWFITQQRLMEYIVYHFCNRYYNQLLHQITAENKKGVSDKVIAS